MYTFQNIYKHEPRCDHIVESNVQYLDGEKEEPDKVKQWQGGVGRAAANPGELVL